MPSPAISMDDKSVTFADGAVVDKARFSPASIAKFSTQIAATPNDSGAEKLAPMGAGIVKDYITLPQVTTPLQMTASTGSLLGVTPAPQATGVVPQAPAPSISLPSTDPVEAQPRMAATVPVSQTETTRVSGTKLSPELLGQQGRLFAAQGQQLDDAAAIAQRKAQEDVAAAAVAKQRQDAVRADFAQKRADLDKQVQDQLTKSQTAVNELRASKESTTEPTGGERVVNAISLALGAFGAALSGGPNTAMQIIDNRINRKIAAQKAELDRKGKVVDLENNQLAQLMSRGLNLTQAEAAMRQMGYEDAQQDLSAISAKYGGEQAAVAAAKLKNDLEARQLGVRAEQEAAAQGKVQTQTVTKNVSSAPDLKDLKTLQDMVKADPSLAKFRDARDAVDRFRDLRRSGAEGAALVDFVANALKQGSYDPAKFEAALKRRGLVGASLEKLRSAWSGGVPPDMLNEIESGLNAGLGTATNRAEKSIKMFRSLGAPDAMLVGGQTSDDKAAALGGQESK